MTRLFGSIIAFLFLSMGTATAGELKQTEIGMHPVCGPVPWQARYASNYGKTKDWGLEVSAKANVVTPTEGSVAVKNSSRVETTLGAFELPVNGEQWLAMYMIYMECVDKVETTDHATEIWLTIPKGSPGYEKRVEAAIKFMTATSTLTKTSADARWLETKALLDEEFSDQRDLIATESARIDGLLAETKAMRIEFTALKAANDQLSKAVEYLTFLVQSGQKEMQKSIDVIEARQDKIEDKQEVVKDAIEEVVTNT